MKFGRFLFLAACLGVLCGVGAIATSIGADVYDGGNAQVIQMAPGYTGNVQQDYQYSRVNVNNSEANYNNASADATTTLANAEAAQGYAGIFIAAVAVAVIIAGISTLKGGKGG